ncbi:conserved oligomeric Golgi complex subunit 3 [Leptidea sinapis]|uniref:conserved oligomeric Golgi complex subunit 3 n=1 Tax=Leptidea sinapis TaxID=189913 RepID=UPI0021433292|nr:conserved oligomeric Golgi complex subunit 3 [Leptidea sinapis]
METMTIKEIQNKLLLWEAAENPLAPLTATQREAILDLEASLQSSDDDIEEEPQKHDTITDIPHVNTTYDFLDWYETLSEQNMKTNDIPYEEYYKQLADRRDECNSLTDQIAATLSDLNTLSDQYNLVSNKTTALHTMSEQLLADQNKLSNIGDDLKQKLQYFTQVDHLSQRLNSPTISVNSDTFFNVISKIDECLEYMRAHSNFKEAHSYTVKYRHLQSRGMALIRSYVNHILNIATEQVLTPDDPSDTDSMDTAYAVYFGKFQAAAPKLKMVISEIEKRAEVNEDYASLLSDVQREYAGRRQNVTGGATARALRSAGGRHARDHCALLRAACSLLALAVRDEWALYQHFFTRTSPPFEEYLQSLCNCLYETLRPHIIHINHLETLAELCVILKVEVIEEQVNNDIALAGLGAAARALLEDAQERLVFRAHVHLRADVLHYKPAPGDLAYPDKLLMMEQIALSLQEQSLKRCDSRNSLASEVSTTSQEVANINVEAQRRPQASPADLHGMWYPGVRRTLAALSRLYRCLEKRVFQGLAQEAISLCVQSVSNAANQISATKTNIDGQLFEIKHLLIVREQIAPFQVDFVIKETSLDFSNMKNAAYGLIQKPRQIFSLNSNNALLEFLLEGTPMVREHLLDSRKEVDRQLKSCCEQFIKDATEILVGPIKEFIDKVHSTPVDQIKLQPWATPSQIAIAVHEAQRRIKLHLATLQRSMQLYLANKETEFILFRPIRNNVVGLFMQLEQYLTNNGYTHDDILIVACPTPEQISVFISSASLISHSETVLPYGKKRPISAIRKPSATSIPEKKGETTVESIQSQAT